MIHAALRASSFACSRGNVRLIFLPFGHRISPSGEIWDACAARGKVGPVMGLRPLRGPPLHSPRSTPKEGFQFPSGGEGNASLAAGASLTRCARSGDLPPRRVNAKVRFRFVQSPFQPIIRAKLLLKNLRVPPPFNCTFPVFLPSIVLHQKLVVASPSLYSPQRMRGRWLVLREFAQYAFFWPDKEKSCF